MCTVCGCGKAEVRIDPGLAVLTPVAFAHRHEHESAHADVTAHSHPHEHMAGDMAHDHGDAHSHEHHLIPASASGLSAPGFSEARLVRIEADVLSRNDALAQQNRVHFAGHRVLALNLVSSPGSGKTTLLVRTIEALKDRLPIAVIEGDQQTSNDAQRIRATGAPAVQVNTGKGCHLDASMVARAFDQLHELSDGVLFIENVGNLVCPAGFDLGEAHKVVLASVTEGEDKPLKYPNIFAAAGVMLVSKCDLLPYLDFDVDLLIANARKVRPDIEVIRVSARTGEGMEAWTAWIEQALDRCRGAG
ncbi:MAG TPA: hydrogenase nickel incorporation protein HypB [Xanthomonadales bacterium]|nr:hydrogenase nickel incorporation protein HypB [Xanthomonadales bacterium]